MYDKIVNISFNLWANSEEEGEELRKEIVDFINRHGEQGRKISAPKLTEALRKWEKNPFVRQSIINHFK